MPPTLKHISYRLSMGEIVSWRAPELVQMFILDRLRRAGIPVKGVMLFQGVTAGRIDEYQDMNGNLCYDWYAVDDDA